MKDTVKRLKYPLTSKIQENLTVLRKSMSFKRLLLTSAKMLFYLTLFYFKSHYRSSMNNYIRVFFHVIIKTKLFMATGNITKNNH